MCVCVCICVCSFLATGSDDLNAIIWDVDRMCEATQHTTGHSGNIFSVKVCTCMCLHMHTYTASCTHQRTTIADTPLYGCVFVHSNTCINWQADTVFSLKSLSPNAPGKVCHLLAIKVEMNKMAEGKEYLDYPDIALEWALGCFV